MSITGNIPSDFPPGSRPPADLASGTSRKTEADRASSREGTHPAAEAPVLDHEYDGIVEYDNPMPAWWKNMFWGTFVFSLGYLFWYHLGGNGVSVREAYESDVAEAAALAARESLGQAVSEDSLAVLLSDEASLKEAGAKYAGVCAPCHGERGQGLIGPNLTDDHWIHGGGSLMDIYQVVSAGVPEKGMPPWERQLAPDELRKLTAYVGTLRGTHVAGKAPEGNPVHPSQ